LDATALAKMAGASSGDLCTGPRFSTRTSADTRSGKEPARTLQMAPPRECPRSTKREDDDADDDDEEEEEEEEEANDDDDDDDDDEDAPLPPLAPMLPHPSASAASITFAAYSIEL
jgi:hypothetical protein